MNNYIINENTLMLIKQDFKTKIIEKNHIFTINNDINSILDESCKNYGSSFYGRVVASKYLLGNGYKTPIIINENKEIIFFPTSSLKNSECNWINYNYVEKLFNDKNKTILIFKNSLKIELEISSKFLYKQLLKSSRLESILKSKKK